MTAYEYLCSLPYVPMAQLGNKPIIASKSERRRWLDGSAVIINGVRPKPKEIIKFPVWQLVFFPKGKRRTTFVNYTFIEIELESEE